MTKSDCRPWLQCVELHPDVLSDDFSEDIFALDLGPLSDYLIARDIGRPETGSKRVPTIYRDADAFFAASYLTSGLKSLLEDVLGRLAGKAGNRVIRLQTPFGGGKSHTLAALLHAARSRAALDKLPEAAGLPRPEGVRTAVVDGQFFDATTGKKSPDGEIAARTLWGWIGWSLGGREGYKLMRAQDEARVAPGGDVIIELLRGGPSLILIDELLRYLISAGGHRIGKTTLRDETMLFLQGLTTAVGNVDNAAFVFSLQSSKPGESLDYTDLLKKVEHLAARKDQRREPVEGNEILNVIQRRLLAEIPDAGSVAEVCSREFTKMRRAWAHDEDGRRRAEDEGLALRERIQASYPFHPALIDLMRERWAAIPEFQRTRGALRFLASCLRVAYRADHSRALLGPGDVPIHEQEVRLAFFKEVGQRENFQACLEHDFTGANARTRRIDKRRARESTTEAGKQPAARIATAILLHSFGGLRRGGDDSGDLLPPGIDESEIMAASIGPDLDSTTIQACLKELREKCLYLHFDGVRYCFKTDPNVTLLVEQEAEKVELDDSGTDARIRQMLEKQLAGQSAIVWPAEPGDVPDREPRFLLAYLPLDFESQKHKPLAICEQYGSRQREFRNGLGLAVPSGDHVNSLRRSMRYLLAAERIKRRQFEHNLTRAQRSQLQERFATEKAATESALLKLYEKVQLPESDDGKLTLKSVRIGGCPLEEKGIHERLMELLTTVRRRVFETLAPGKIAALFELGEPGKHAAGIATADVLRGFYEFLGFPRLLSDEAVRKAVARGVETGLFGYVIGEPEIGDDGRYRIDRSRVAFKRSVAADEIDLDAGWLIAPAAMPEEATPSLPKPKDEEDPVPDPIPPEKPDLPTGIREIALSFKADRKKFFDAWNALGNLAEIAGVISIKASATTPEGYDKAKLENGVLEPLRELGLIKDD